MTDFQRNYQLDNAKIFTIFFVVLGHFIEPLLNGRSLMQGVFWFIYSFHMPIFVLISGMLTKASLSDDRLKKLISSTLIPLLAFTLLYEVFNFITLGEISSYTKGAQPYWILWFLLSLFFWRLLLPIFLKLPHPLLLSVVISVMAGYVNDVGYFMGVSRTVYFMPFFVLGYQLSANPQLLGQLSNIPKGVYAAIVSIALLATPWLIDVPHQWLFGSHSYANLGQENSHAGLFRLGQYIYSTLLTLSIFMLLPKNCLWFTKLGDKSLYVFVWHGFFVKVCAGIGLFAFLGSQAQGVTLTGTVFISALITLLLCWNLVAKTTTSLILQPASKLLLKK